MVVPILTAVDQHLHEEQFEYKSRAVLLRRIEMFSASKFLHSVSIYHVEGIGKFFDAPEEYCQ
eukprot:scaffold2153_cov144-Skeletonema_menzelii.AAC.1